MKCQRRIRVDGKEVKDKTHNTISIIIFVLFLHVLGLLEVVGGLERVAPDSECQILCNFKEVPNKPLESFDLGEAN